MNIWESIISICTKAVLEYQLFFSPFENDLNLDSEITVISEREMIIQFVPKWLQFHFLLQREVKLPESCMIFKSGIIFY